MRLDTAAADTRGSVGARPRLRPADDGMRPPQPTPVGDLKLDAVLLALLREIVTTQTELLRTIEHLTEDVDSLHERLDALLMPVDGATRRTA